MEKRSAQKSCFRTRSSANVEKDGETKPGRCHRLDRGSGWEEVKKDSRAVKEIPSHRVDKKTQREE